MPAVDFVELALEETPVYDGAATGATPYRVSTDKLYLPARSARINAVPGHLDRSDELRGIQAAPARLIEAYLPDGALSVRAYAKLLTWIFELAGFVGTFTAGNGIITDPDAVVIPTGASRWVFNKRDAIDAQTAQVKVNHKDESVLLRGNGYGVSGWSLNALGELTADLMGLVLKRLAVDSTTVPSYPAQDIPPFRRRDLTLTWLAGSARTADFSLAGTNPLERIFSLGLSTPSAYPDAMEHGDEQAYVTGSIPKRALDADDFDKLLDAATFSAKARWISDKVIGATAYKYSLWVEMPACQLVGGSPDDMGNKRRIGASYDFFAAYSEGSAFDVKITLVNDVTAIKTFA